MKYSNAGELDHLRELARETAAQVAKVTGAKVSQTARDAAADYKAAIADVLAEDEHMRATLAELDQKAYLLNPDGVAQLKQSIVNDHKARAKEADNRAAAALVALKTQLQQDALPKVDPAREALSRQELQIAIGNSSGEALVGSLMALADSGSPDTLAVLLNSSFGDTLLKAREVTGKRADEAMADLRATAANAAARRGDSEAAALVGIDAELVSARAAAMSTVAATADEAIGFDAGAPR